MNDVETSGALMRLDNAGVEAAAYVIGARQKREPARRKPR
jgi:hypothetical protein